jgi:hypothetical protein
MVLFFLTACLPSASGNTPQVIDVYATSAAYPWLSDVYDCSPGSVAIRLADPGSAEVTLRLGEPSPLLRAAYQVGKDDLLVVIYPQNGVGSLTVEQVRLLFAGQITNWKDVGGADLPVQVWVYSPAVDVQFIFDESFMGGRPVTSLARLAVSAQYMSDSIGAVPGSIGILPRRWKTGNTREALVVTYLPVLAVVRDKPEGILRDLISCLQTQK